jgi:hypothetical protein
MLLAGTHGPANKLLSRDVLDFSQKRTGMTNAGAMFSSVHLHLFDAGKCF